MTWALYPKAVDPDVAGGPVAFTQSAAVADRWDGAAVLQQEPAR